MSDEKQRLEDALLQRVMRTSKGFGLLERGDRIMVCVSGGKDSYTLLHLLTKLRRRLPFPIELVAVHLDQKQPGYDGRGLRAHLEGTGLPFEILEEDTYSVVTQHIPEGKTYCSLCSRLRRGILYTAAARLGVNKIALGHHRDDTLETFLLNLFYAGKLQAMPAQYTTDDGRFRVIRPLVECAEADIARFAALEGFPIIPCNLCGSQEDLKRDRMSALLAQLEAAHPTLRQVMLAALQNVRPTHLLDVEVTEAWAARPAHLAARSEARATTPHFAATPVVAHYEDLLAPPTAAAPSPAASRLPVLAEQPSGEPS
jgi:tRNA 2-thiocytidine biosynthesis protein TtcA